MITRLIIGVLAGAVLGGIVGYVGKCSGGACPLTCHPVGGMLTGAAIGLLIMLAVQPRGGGATANFVPSKNVIEIQSTAQFDEIVKQKPVVLADLYADWCGPCQRLKPAIHQLADEYAGRATVVGVNVDVLKELAARYGVSSIPDVRIFRGGKPSQQLIGLRDKQEYAAALDAALK